MFLSSLKLNTSCRDVRRDLGSVYEMHRTIMNAFRDSPRIVGELVRGVLWRVDHDRHADWPVLLVQSAAEPKWHQISDLSPNYFSAGSELDEAVRVKPLPPFMFRIGQTLAFRLRGNPTIKRNGKRLGLSGTNAYHDWLARKAQLHGFVVSHELVIPESEVRAVRAGTQMCFMSCLFSGTLVVSDPQRFSEALLVGIGSGKAFGFGLLSVAPSNNNHSGL
jgi:CRISPR system Cascade subunit CasE